MYQVYILTYFFLITIHSFAQCQTNDNTGFYDSFKEFPVFETDKYDLHDDGYIFLSVSSTSSIPYIMIIDNNAVPVYIKQLKKQAYDFKVNNNMLTYFDEAGKQFFMMDSMYQIIDSIKIKNDFITDFHDIQITSDNHILLLGQDIKSVNMDTVVDGGNPNATVTGLVIQELDENKDVVFEWKSWDHYKITDSYVNLLNQSIDYVHGNSVDIDSDGNLIISACFMSEVTKIDRNTGEIIWRLGGKNNEFTFVADDGFNYQHSARRLPNGNLVLLDKGYDNDPLYSRGVEYIFDEENKTVELVRSYIHHPKIYAQWMGNIQHLPNGNKIIGWGSNSGRYFFTEFDHEGNMLYDLKTPDGVTSYRAFRFPWKTNLFEPNIDSLDFGSVECGDKKSLTVNITNNSDADIELTSYSTLDSVFCIVNEFPLEITAKGSINLQVNFSPLSKGGEYKDVITINSDGISELGLPQRIATQIKLKGYAIDNIPPEIDMYPDNNSIGIPVDTNVLIRFSEPVRYLDNSTVTEENIKDLIQFKKDDINGANIEYNLVFDNINYELILTPDENLNSNSSYCIYIEDLLKDFSDNRMDYFSACFSTEINTFSGDSKFDHAIIYPNPTEGLTRIHFYQKPVSILVFNIEGIQIYEDNNISFPVYDLNFYHQKNGVYVLKVIYKDSIDYYKFIKE